MATTRFDLAVWEGSEGDGHVGFPIGTERRWGRYPSLGVATWAFKGVVPRGATVVALKELDGDIRATIAGKQGVRVPKWAIEPIDGRILEPAIGLLVRRRLESGAEVADRAEFLTMTEQVVKYIRTTDAQPRALHIAKKLLPIAQAYESDIAASPTGADIKAIRGIPVIWDDRDTPELWVEG